MNSYRIVANFMQASVFLLKIQHFKYLKSVFLNIYNCAWKVAFLKSSHKYSLLNPMIVIWDILTVFVLHLLVDKVPF